jgi:hypothetical protein
MRNGIIRFAIAWFSLQLAPANDFQKSYTISPDSQITFENFLGNIKLTGYKGKTVELIANKKGPDSDLIEINDDRRGNGIRIFSRYPLATTRNPVPPSRGGLPPPSRGGPPPSSRGGPPPSSRGGPPPSSRGGPPPPSMGGLPFGAPVPPNPIGVSKASVDFEIHMPQSIDYKQVSLSTLFGNGKIEVSEVKGNFKIMSGTESVDVKNVVGQVTVSSTSGKVEVSEVRGSLWIISGTGAVEIKNVIGPVTATSNSGTVSVFLGHNNEPRNMVFGSISGNVIVQAPANLSAMIDMLSHGLIHTNFPISIQEDRYGGKYVHGDKLGAGKDQLKIYSNTGQVSLTHK